MSGEDVRFIIGAVLIALGAIVFVISVIGVYRFRAILSRMHAAALGDTLGLFLVLAGLIVISGFTFHSLKLALVIITFWVASPVSSHLLCRLEILMNPKLEEDCEIRFDIDKKSDREIDENIEEDGNE